MIQDYAWLLFGTSALSFCVAYIITLKKLSKSQKAFLELLAASAKLQEIINELSTESRSESDIHKDNFIKFISDSRDWAFEYIEEVQDGLKKFVEDIEPEIEYFKEYGDVMGMQPNYYSMKKIVESYNELKKLLPGTLEETK
jgi:hypothetical protein